jgi:phosphatidylglycerophosphate synthase
VSTLIVPALRSSHSAAAAEHCSARSVETNRDVNYPLSRWYLRPLAVAYARQLAATRLRPWHVTLTGLGFALAAAATVIALRQFMPVAAGLLWAYWFCDRMDGPLARFQGAATARGAWLDANVDELVDLGLHSALACAAALAGSTWSWHLFAAFLFGKYLLMYGLLVDQSSAQRRSIMSSMQEASMLALARRLYHLPANADVRIHLLLAAMLTGQLVLELALVAIYYNFRWLARYALLARRSWRKTP